MYGLNKQSLMNRNHALALLRKIKPVVAQRFGVDILVSFDGPATSARYFGAQFYLEDQLGLPVDLVTDKALRPELRPFLEKEAINV